MKRYFYLSLSFLLLCMRVQAQDPQFSQYYASPLYLNPAFTGVTEQYRASVNHRLQWPNLPQTFSTYAFAMDYNMVHLNSGFGLLVTTDKAGTSSLRNTNAGFLYSYKIRLRDKWVISPGFNFSYTIRDIDYDKMLFPDQFSNDGTGTLPVSPGGISGSNLEQIQYFDFGTGLLMYNRTTWFGVAAHHLPQPNNSMMGGEDPLPIKYTVHGGIKLQLYNGPKVLGIMPSISPSFIYKMQGGFNQLDLGVNFNYSPIVAGLWYRGIPVLKGIDAQSRRDAVAFIMGLRFDQIQFAYSYDITVSRLGFNSGGAHEVSLIYEFTYRNLTKVKRKDKFMPCPSF